MYAQYLPRFAICVAVTGTSPWPQHAVHHNDSMSVKSPFRSVVCFLFWFFGHSVMGKFTHFAPVTVNLEVILMVFSPVILHKRVHSLS